MERQQTGTKVNRRRRTSYSVRLGYGEYSLTELVEAIRNDDDWAWQALVDRLSGNVWGALSSFNVDNHLRHDAAAETWKTLFEHLDRVRDTERLSSWVAVVARNNMCKILAKRNRWMPCGDVEQMANVAGVADQDRLVDGEVRDVLERAVDRLSPREQAIVRGRAFADELESLASIEERLGIPSGSIGPTLGRCVRKLRKDAEIVDFFPEIGREDRSRTGKTGAT